MRAEKFCAVVAMHLCCCLFLKCLVSRKKTKNKHGSGTGMKNQGSEFVVLQLLGKQGWVGEFLKRGKNQNIPTFYFSIFKSKELKQKLHFSIHYHQWSHICLSPCTRFLYLSCIAHFTPWPWHCNCHASVTNTKRKERKGRKYPSQKVYIHMYIYVSSMTDVNKQYANSLKMSRF